MGHPDNILERFLEQLPGTFKTITLSDGENGFAGFAFNIGYIRHRHTEIRQNGETFIETLVRARGNYASQQPTVFQTTSTDLFKV